MKVGTRVLVEVDIFSLAIGVLFGVALGASCTYNLVRHFTSSKSDFAQISKERDDALATLKEQDKDNDKYKEKVQEHLTVITDELHKFHEQSANLFVGVAKTAMLLSHEPVNSVPAKPTIAPIADLQPLQPSQPNSSAQTAGNAALKPTKIEEDEDEVVQDKLAVHQQGTTPVWGRKSGSKYKL